MNIKILKYQDIEIWDILPNSVEFYNFAIEYVVLLLIFLFIYSLFNVDYITIKN